MRRIISTLCGLSFLLCSIQEVGRAVGSGGFENQVPHARSMGRANSVVASVDDASAVSFNPARLTDVPGDVSLGVSFQKVNTEYSGSGVNESTKSDPAFSPNLHWASKLGKEKWGFGLGLNVPHGLGNEWSKTGVVAPNATTSELVVLDLNPAVGYKINDKFSLGFGIDIYQATAELKTYNSGTTTESTIEGDGSGIGASIGFSGMINEKHLVGLSYRTGSNMIVEGTYKTVGGSNSSYNIESELNIPAELMLGYAYKPSQALTLEMDFQWDRWSSFDNQELKDTDANNTIATIPKDWQDRWSIGLGTEYALRPNLFLRGGYAFWSSPVPNETFEPSTPDADTHLLTGGIGTLFQNNVTLDLALQLGFLNNRHIENGIAPTGTYKTTAQYVAVNVGYKFGKIQ
jgi:long-chain fatty acid transport protein